MSRNLDRFALFERQELDFVPVDQIGAPVSLLKVLAQRLEIDDYEFTL
jgi:hypothetical protein